MKKAEQKKYITDALQVLKDNGLPIGWLLKKANISRTHWYFLKRGERPLTEGNQNKIRTILYSIPKTPQAS